MPIVRRFPRYLDRDVSWLGPFTLRQTGVVVLGIGVCLLESFIFEPTPALFFWMVVTMATFLGWAVIPFFGRTAEELAMDIRRYRKRPRRHIWSVSAKGNKKLSLLQELLDVHEIRNNAFRSRTRPVWGMVVFVTEMVNIPQLPEDLQLELTDGWQSTLDSLDFDCWVFDLTRDVNLNEDLRTLEEGLASEPEELLAFYARDYHRLVTKVTQGKKHRDTTAYILVMAFEPFVLPVFIRWLIWLFTRQKIVLDDPVESALRTVADRAEHIETKLLEQGLSGRALTGAEIPSFFRKFWSMDPDILEQEWESSPSSVAILKKVPSSSNGAVHAPEIRSLVKV